MAKLSDVIEGLQILAKYQPDDASIGGASHDIIWGGDLPAEDANNDDTRRLDELGWHWSSECDCWSRFV